MEDKEEQGQFQYQERILVDSSTENSDVTVLRLESSSTWYATTSSSSSVIVHPFAHLERLFAMIDENNEIIDVTIQISSRATQRIPATNHRLNIVPIINTNAGTKNSLPSGPSGFWLSIRSSPSTSLNLERVEKYVNSWIRQKLITTPILSSSKDGTEPAWDIIRTDDDNNNNSTVFQLFLPSNGDAWSADALYQSLRSSLGCSNKDFMGRSATEWSNLLVTGKVWDKIMWWKISSSSSSDNNLKQHQVTVGIQYEEPKESATAFISSLESQSLESSCLLGSRSVLYVQPPPPTTTSNGGPSSYQLVSIPPKLQPEDGAQQSLNPLLSVDLVVRRPWPQKGRLETWISAAEPLTTTTTRKGGGDCRLQIRQVLPPILIPSWQTLDVTATTINGDNVPMKPYVEWKEDGTTILSISSSSSSSFYSFPASVFISLDYNPKFLTFDDFPGDPNRGRDLPPVVVTMTCPVLVGQQQHEGLSSASSYISNYYYYEVFSNSPMILPPVPDMSMPFNVLSLTCSLYAYLIGTLITLIIKRSSEKIVYKLHPEKKPKSKIQKLKEKIKSKFQKQKNEQDDDNDDDDTMEEEEEKNSQKQDTETEDSTSSQQAGAKK